MVKNELENKTVNAAIQAASNYIGQKLFAYISHGKNINDRIREKFSKAMIFIGDEGQIYNPLTNTYIGIGQTAYTHAISYIEEAHQKIDNLNKMLTSSMVTSIYANWDEETWRNMTYIASGNAGSVSDELKQALVPGKRSDNTQYDFADALPTKVFATNDIVLRGIGDYDPTTKLAYTREIAHIVDKNNLDPNTATALEGSYIINKSNAAFATSGITVSLEKGLNKYMFTYTFNHPMSSDTAVPGADPTIWTQTDIAATINGKEISNYAEKVTFYLTKDEVEKCIEPFTSGNWPSEWTIPGTTKVIRKADIERISSKGNETVVNPLKHFWEGVVPVWDDEVLGTQVKREGGKWKFGTETPVDYWFSGGHWKELQFISHQLFKQGKNVMTIDDKLTWSYISSAYSYALDFSKEYTDTQVERIYRDLLGSANTLLIPCSVDQVKVQKVNPGATKTLDLVKVVWSETEQKWVTSVKNSGGGDTLYDSSANLADYKLNEGSIYVKKFSIPKDTVLESCGVNTTTIQNANDTVLPWFVLTELAKISEKYMKDWDAAYAKNPEILKEDGKNGISYILALDGTTHLPYRDNYTDKLHDSFVGHKFEWQFTVTASSDQAASPAEAKTVDGVFEVTAATDWNNIYFMNYERDTNYPDKIKINGTEVTINKEDWTDGNGEFIRPDDENLHGTETNGNLPLDSNDMSKNDKGTSNPANGQWGVPVGSTGSKWNGTQYHQHGYRGSKYSLDGVYRIVDNLADIVEQQGNETTTENRELNNQLFVVNTKWTSMNGVNLADGIQTLKEITYVLDIITDGWGNHYEDAEGNGILLTYTIANNHDRIVDHEKRLKQIESGTNVVKGIGRLDHMMSNYVDLQLTSDVLWKFKDHIKINSIDDQGIHKDDKFHLAEDNIYEFASRVWDISSIAEDARKDAINQLGDRIYGLPEKMGFVGVTKVASRWSESKGADGQTTTPHEFTGNEAEGIVDTLTGGNKYFYLQQIPVSYIIAYNSYVRNWVKDTEFRTSMGIALDSNWVNEADHTIKHPVFSDVFPEYRTIGVIEVTNDILKETNESGQTSTYVFTSPEGRFTAIHSYVGHVGVGIDLKLAQTYTTSNIQGGESGFVCVDIRSSIIKKKVNVYAKLPKDIVPDTKIDWKGDASDVNNFHKRYAENINSADALNDTDKALLTEQLADMGLTLTNINTFTGTVVDSLNSYGAEFTFEFVIDINDAIDTEAPLFGEGLNNYDKRLYSDADNVVVDEVKGITYPIYNAKIAQKLHDVRTDIKGADGNPALIIVPSDYAAQKFYVRYNHLGTTTAVDLDYDGLTTTNWVATYVAATVNSVSKQLKAVEYEAYRFSENLIKGLDNSVYGSRGKFVSGIEQRNGIVTPIYKDLPKDELLASYTIWGENTDKKRQYVRVSAEDIYKQEVLHGGVEEVKDGENVIATIANDFPLYVAPAGVYDYVLCTPENIPASTTTIDGASAFITDSDETNGANNISAWATRYNVVPENGKYVIYTFDEATKTYVPFVQEKVNALEFDSELKSEGSSGDLLLSSWKAGKKYGMYVPMYFRTQRYERVDGAQLRRRTDETEYKLTFNKVEYTTGALEAEVNKAIYTTNIATNYDKRERKYITATSDYSDQSEIGNGKNTLQITAHITKLVDADKDNSGLVDAYDVKSTINAMFEWVDLSRWDMDNDAPSINPMNSDYQEAGGYYTDAFRIDNAGTMGVPVYPRASFGDKDYADNIGGYEHLPEETKNSIAAGKNNNYKEGQGVTAPTQAPQG